MEIKIGYDLENNNFVRNEPKPINKVEFKILETIAKDLDLKDYIIVANSDDYTTMQYKQIDLVRIKYTERAKWISICLTPEDKKENINNPLFEAQKNKNQVFWKSNIKDDISVYYHFIKNTYDKR